MLIAPTRGWPFTIAMPAQIERHRVFDRHTALEQRLEKVIPTAPLIAHAVHENVSLLLRIAPFPIM